MFFLRNLAGFLITFKLYSGFFDERETYKKLKKKPEIIAAEFEIIKTLAKIIFFYNSFYNSLYSCIK